MSLIIYAKGNAQRGASAKTFSLSADDSQSPRQLENCKRVVLLSITHNAEYDAESDICEAR